MQPHNNLGIGALLDHYVKIHPNKIAIYYEDTSITYKSFKQSILNYQNHFKKMLDPNQTQKVALLLGNQPRFLEVYFAVVMLGWIAVPFDPKWTKSEADNIKNQVQPDLIVTNDAFTHIASYQFEEAISVNTFKTISLTSEHLSIAHAGQAFYLGFTSGSTGTPKGFLRHQSSWIRSFEAAESVFKYTQNDIIMAPGPLNHSLSLFGATHALHMGASFCLTTAFNAKQVFDIIQQHSVTVLYGVPTMFHSLASLNKRYIQPITCLSSGAKLDSQVITQLKTILPQAFIYEYYGASELSFITYATNEFSYDYPESVGVPFPSVQITIRNQLGNKLSSNQIGDIYVQSDFLFSQYWNNQALTNETLTKHGACIGDIGFLDEYGALTVIGRKNNMIITGGNNVYPEEIERVITKVRSIKEVVVIGVSDVHWGEKIIAFIKWKEDHQPDLPAVKKVCKTHLSIYKRPRKFVSVIDFPYTHTGKISRQALKNNVKELLT